jgi:hypothetical protein
MKDGTRAPLRRTASNRSIDAAAEHLGVDCACSEFRAAHPAPVEDWSVEEIEQYLDACTADQAAAERVGGGR